MADPAAPDLLTLTAQIVAAHVTGNTVPPDALPSLINDVYDALARVDAPVAEAQQPQEPAVPIKRSIQHDALICLEDGAKLKVLTRYLVRFGLTPETYRAKWGLPRDYPMVAPAYAARRSALAKQFGLGTASRTVDSAPQEEPELGAEPELEMKPAIGAEPEPPTAPVDPEVQHTAASVFANFPGQDAPAEATPAANDAGKPGRKRFAQQSMRVGRKR